MPDRPGRYGRPRDGIAGAEQACVSPFARGRVHTLITVARPRDSLRLVGACGGWRGIMSHTTQTQRRSEPVSHWTPDAVGAAYRRWASFYDVVGGVSAWARRRAVAETNRLPGFAVLEMGVGNRAGLPRYRPEKRINRHRSVGRKLARARARVPPAVDECLRAAENGRRSDQLFRRELRHRGGDVCRLRGSEPRRLLRRLRAGGAAGGHILFGNHFAPRVDRAWWVERALAPASRKLGWHPDSPSKPCCAMRTAVPRPCVPCRRSACSRWCTAECERTAGKFCRPDRFQPKRA